MKVLRFLITGIIFGIILSKSEAISWFRIQEMFRFHSFHMYGIIGSAIMVGVTGIQLINKFSLKSVEGNPIILNPKAKTYRRYIIGGTIFGMGWALSGACPGPMFILLGNGVSIILIPIFSAIVGTFIYGLLRDKLPH